MLTPIYQESPPAGGGIKGGEVNVRALSDLDLALALGVFDEIFSPLQRLAISNALAVWVMALAGSQDAALLAALSAFWEAITRRDYPAAYAEVIAVTRLQV